jgi:hypothetical protein
MKLRRSWIAIIGILGLLAIGALTWRPAVQMVGLLPFAPRSSPAAPPSPRAAVIDQVGLTHPNPEFVKLASAMLEVAGYQVDVYTGDQITVEFYKNLATHGYRLIIFRTHSSNVDVTGEIGLFTSEVYREDRWAMEQLRGRLAFGHTIPEAGGPAYFAVVPAFVRKEMQGRLDDTLLIIGGCESLASPQLAQAFIDRGALAVIGWNDTVDLAYNDRAILRLLLAVVGEKMSVEEAVRRTMIDVGPDPVYGSRLAYLGQG